MTLSNSSKSNTTQVCFTVRKNNEIQHLAGINKIIKNAHAPSNFFTACRDGNVREFTDLSSPKCVKLWSEHDGWVNDITQISERICSVSNDGSVRICGEKTPIYWHDDYVKSVVSFGNRVYSAGLDCNIKSVDLGENLSNSQNINNTQNNNIQNNLTNAVLDHSIYSLGISETGILAAGNSASVVYLFDQRENNSRKSSTVKLSHGGSRTVISSVRFLDDQTVLSSDCDGMVKVWSLANFSKPISTISCEAGVSCLEIGTDGKVYAGLLTGGVLYADYRMGWNSEMKKKPGICFGLT